jgi:hypothetical protein
VSGAARRAAASFAALAVAALALPALAAAQDEPVELSVTAPPVVAAHAPIKVSVRVSAEPGALDIAAMPLRLRVALAPECGGSYAGTTGSIALYDDIPAPASGSPYAFTARGHTKVADYGRETVCAFLEDTEERQFATSTEATVDVSKPCTLAIKRLAKLRRQTKRASGDRRRDLKRAARRARRHKRVACLQLGAGGSAARTSAAVASPKIKHLFVLILENEDSEVSFGPNPPSAYLGKTLPERGALVPNYFGIGHNSLDNYLAMISGQPPNPVTQADCSTYSEMAPATLNTEGIALGTGCVFPSTVKTVANQLEEHGHTWGGFMEDMAAAGHPTCGHPTIGGTDENFAARAGSQYATRHDPFVYFHSIIDTPACQKDVVDLTQLPADLRTEKTTPEYTFITPDLCADGHDATCADGSSPAGYAGINSFLSEWVPQIEASPAFQDEGMLLVTFDESENGAESCCGEPTGPNTVDNGGTRPGTGGGKVGAVMVSPCIQPGTISDADYNHYSQLRWVEDNFGLPHLANAAPAGVGAFGSDVFTRPDCDKGTRLKVRPKRAAAGKRTAFRFQLLADLSRCREGATVTLAGHKAKTNKKGVAVLKAKLHGRQATAKAASAICTKPATARVKVKGG